jgi:hypothetical protein
MPPKRRCAVVFIHGLAKKPPSEKLLELWHWGIGRDNPRPDVFAPPNKGLNLGAKGVVSELNYYADVFYGEDFDTDISSYYEAEGDAEAEMAADNLGPSEPAPALPASVTLEEQEFLTKFTAKLTANVTAMPVVAGATSPDAGEGSLEIAGLLPAVWREAVIKKAAMEAYYFLFDKEYVRPDGTKFMVRKELRERLLANLASAAAKAEKIVIISHSMGTMVAYDVLRNCPTCPPIDTLITLGSPLGVKEVQAELKAAGADGVDFPAARVRRWINIYDPLDPICGADPKFSNDFAPVGGKHVEDVKESNWSKWRHTITHYLAGTRLREHLNDAIS